MGQSFISKLGINHKRKSAIFECIWSMCLTVFGINLVGLQLPGIYVNAIIGVYLKIFIGKGSIYSLLTLNKGHFL